MPVQGLVRRALVVLAAWMLVACVATGTRAQWGWLAANVAALVVCLWSLEEW